MYRYINVKFNLWCICIRENNLKVVNDCCTFLLWILCDYYLSARDADFARWNACGRDVNGLTAYDWVLVFVFLIFWGVVKDLWCWKFINLTRGNTGWRTGAAPLLICNGLWSWRAMSCWCYAQRWLWKRQDVIKPPWGTWLCASWVYLTLFLHYDIQCTVSLLLSFLHGDWVPVGFYILSCMVTLSASWFLHSFLHVNFEYPLFFTRFYFLFFCTVTLSGSFYLVFLHCDFECKLVLLSFFALWPSVSVLW